MGCDCGGRAALECGSCVGLGCEVLVDGARFTLGFRGCVMLERLAEVAAFALELE